MDRARASRSVDISTASPNDPIGPMSANTYGLGMLAGMPAYVSVPPTTYSRAAEDRSTSNFNGTVSLPSRSVMDGMDMLNPYTAGLRSAYSNRNGSSTGTPQDDGQNLQPNLFTVPLYDHNVSLMQSLHVQRQVNDAYERMVHGYAQYIHTIPSLSSHPNLSSVDSHHTHGQANDTSSSQGGFGRQSPATDQGESNLIPVSAPVSSRRARIRAFLDLHFHRTVDGDVERYACKTCGRKIKRGGDAKRHWMSKHGGQNPSCHKCGRRYSRPDALNQHNKLCVGSLQGSA